MFKSETINVTYNDSILKIAKPITISEYVDCLDENGNLSTTKLFKNATPFLLSKLSMQEGTMDVKLTKEKVESFPAGLVINLIEKIFEISFITKKKN